ncbi:MAG: nitrate reductase associated protein [Cyanobacteriota bacterium]|nr:nitrate reductase associated protein [Cyanobacteriota bacterium]
MSPTAQPAPDALACRMFRFEADFAGDLRCLPMAVRRKLDLAGVKLKLVHWHGLSEVERQRLLAWGDDGPSLKELRHWLFRRSQTLPQGPAVPLPPAQGADWQRAEEWPETVVTSCRELGLALRPDAWRELDELQRFALVKLSHPGHEHRNLPKALKEFALLAIHP